MKKIIICVFLLLGGCTSNDANVSELQAKVDELSVIIERQEKEIENLSLKNEGLNQDIDSLIHADKFGGVDEKFIEYFDLNVVNEAVDFVKLNKPSEDMNQDLVGIYVGHDDGNAVVLQVYPSSIVIYLSITSDGTQLSYDGKYKRLNGVGSFYISPLNPGITYTDVTLVDGMLKTSSCAGICSSQDEFREIEFKKLR